MARRNGVKVSEFLNLDYGESHYFMLLLQLERAGSVDLKEYYKKQIDKILEHRAKIKNSIKVSETLSAEDQAIYYSDWYWAAIHILVSVPYYKSKQKIADRLSLPIEVVSECLEYLQKLGLVTEGSKGFTIGATRIHLDKKSPFISRHHTNWRLKAINDLEKNKPSSLHYSSVLSLSESDFDLIKTKILALLEDIEPILVASPEEDIVSLCLDFFKV